MKMYVYKIQWLFPVIGDFVTPKEKRINELFAVIKAIGARSLTVVNFMDRDMKVIQNYTDMVMFPSETSTRNTILSIKNEIEKNDEIIYVELLRM